MIKIQLELPNNCEECGLVCNDEHECVVMRRLNRDKYIKQDARVWEYEKEGTKPDWCPLLCP